MRFLFYSHYFYPEVGAPQTRLLAVARELKRKGHVVDIITSMPNYPIGEIHKEFKSKIYSHSKLDDINIYRSTLWPTKSSGMWRLLSYLSFQFMSLPLLLWLLLRHKNDVLFIESPPIFLPLSGILLKYFSKTIVVTNLADLWPEVFEQMQILSSRSTQYKLLDLVANVVYRMSDRLTIVIPDMRQELRLKGIADNKILELRNGVDTEFFKPLPFDSSHSINILKEQRNAQHVILYAGNHGHAQRLNVLVDTAILLKDRSDILFLCVGDGTARQDVELYANQRGACNIVFQDPVSLDEMPSYYSACSVSLALSTIPGIASKIFGALACKKPVIYMGKGEGPALLIEKNAGIGIFEFCDKKLAQAILDLVDNPSLADELSRNGRRLCVSDFSWQKIVERWLTNLV